MEEKEELDERLKDLVICPKCKAVNRNERYCHNCNVDLLEALNEETTNNNSNEETTYINSSDSSNMVAEKFLNYANNLKLSTVIISVILIIGGIITAINTSFISIIGVIIGVLLLVGYTSIQVMNLQGKAEIINLLQDIKNK